MFTILFEKQRCKQFLLSRFCIYFNFLFFCKYRNICRLSQNVIPLNFSRRTGKIATIQSLNLMIFKLMKYFLYCVKCCFVFLFYSFNRFKFNRQILVAGGLGQTLRNNAKLEKHKPKVRKIREKVTNLLLT